MIAFRKKEIRSILSLWKRVESIDLKRINVGKRKRGHLLLFCTPLS